MATQRASHDLTLSTAAHGDVSAHSSADNSPISPESYAANYPLQDKEAALIREQTRESERPGERPDESFKTMRWWNASLLMLAETISLGILALPHATAALGFFPGLFFIAIFGFVATYAGYVIGMFKLANMEVNNVGDAGAVLFRPLGPRASRIGRQAFGTLSVIFLVFVMAAHVLSFGIMLNVVTDHASCTILFLISGTLLSFVLCLPRRLVEVSWISLFSTLSVLAAVFTTMIGVSMERHGVPSDQTKTVAEGTSFVHGLVALLDIVMAYSGNVAFFNFMSEMRYPAEYPKALFTLQGTATCLYLVVAAVIYYYAGTEVTSPALGSAPTKIRDIAYYLAIPTIVVAGVVNGHVAVKMVFRSWKRGMEEQRGKRPYFWWVVLNVLLWTCAWVLAESVPNFGNLLALVSALLGTWFTYGLSTGLWFFMNYGRYTASWKKMALVALNGSIFIMTLALSVLGMYASIEAIRADSEGKVWSCARNDL